MFVLPQPCASVLLIFAHRRNGDEAALQSCALGGPRQMAEPAFLGCHLFCTCLQDLLDSRQLRVTVDCFFDDLSGKLAGCCRTVDECCRTKDHVALGRQANVQLGILAGHLDAVRATPYGVAPANEVYPD
jgi:hypothetical protein